MDSFSAIIDRWPSLAAFAADLGVKYVTAQVMRHRDSISARHWGRLVKAARRRGFEGVTLDALAAIAASEPSRRDREDPPSRQSCEPHIDEAPR